jgi:BolA protein
MNTATTIEAKLRAAFAPTRLAVTDDSARHAGHAGARPGGETHFSVEIVSQAFAGQSRVARHRLVYGLLADEIAGGVHALAVTALTPAEDGGR